MGNTQTVVTGTDVKGFLAGVESEQKREDSKTLLDLMGRVTGEKPKLWGSIVGFGRYHYNYESGHEGETCLVGFSPRKAAFSIYLTGNYFPESKAKAEELLGRLGKHTMGKGCLYVKKLADVDLKVLEDLVRLSVDKLREHYPD
jgi:hypothetical protein